MMIVVSKNQVILPSFIPIMINSEDYKALKKTEQENLNELMKDGNTSIRFTSECDSENINRTESEEEEYN